ncbi:MAG: molybdopterin-synthase adenylyltransferase MoeB [Acidimicrobiia bacterium]|nr:MAG: molybdopterin-synthase adenylyltransferase MoeB [Acidimicrobiia bacterium]
MTASYQDLVNQARQQIREIDPAEVERRLTEVTILDIREADEFDRGAISGAHLAPRGILESVIGLFAADFDQEVVLYCAVGARSALAAQTLQQMGYTDVSSLAGGFNRWKNEGLPWRPPESLTAEQRARYSRHILLPEVGEEGQVKLLESSVLLVGAGGLGSPAALYLAAAGVGTIGIVDFDVVDTSNLQRQILHNVERIGQPKVDSARETLTALNPDIKVVTYNERLSAANVLDIFAGYDVVVDGGDNFPTRYLVNDAALHLRIPVVHGSVFRFEGQVTVFDPYVGPCYRCQFPEPPPPELAPSCAEAGVLGALTGIIGSIQAIETVKTLLGIGEGLTGRLLTYDALSQEFRTLRVGRDPGCPACADEDQPPLLVEYDITCAHPGSVARVG